MTDISTFHLRIGTRDVTLIEGPAGWGEMSPVPGYPCDPAAARGAALEAATVGWPARLRDEVAVNALVPSALALDVPAPWMTAASVKVKVGTQDLDADLARVAAVRDRIGPDARLRVDANGAWDVDTAVSTIRAMAQFDLEFVEQPVEGLEDLARVRRDVPVRIAADEAVRTVVDALRMRELAAADVVVLKVQPVGGVRAALEIADAAGVPAVVTSMLETSIGLAAGLALACALPELSFACGLATLGEIDGDVVAEPLAPCGDWLRVPDVFPPVPTPENLSRYARSS